MGSEYYSMIIFHPFQLYFNANCFAKPHVYNFKNRQGLLLPKNVQENSKNIKFSKLYILAD
jgi:hypothetical protein